jgi:hypothetical protein
MTAVSLDGGWSGPPLVSAIESRDSLIVLGQNEVKVLKLRGELLVVLF